MSEIITQEGTAIETQTWWTSWLCDPILTKVKRWNVKVTRSHNVWAARTL